MDRQHKYGSLKDLQPANCTFLGFSRPVAPPNGGGTLTSNKFHDPVKHEENRQKFAREQDTKGQKYVRKTELYSYRLSRENLCYFHMFQTTKCDVFNARWPGCW